MEKWKKAKYLKIALETCGSSRKGYVIRSYNEFLKFLEAQELELENRKIKIEFWEKSIKTCSYNIDIARKNLIYWKGEMEKEGIRKREKEIIREKITDNELNLGDAEKYISDAKEWIREEKDTIQIDQLWLDNFYKVEGLMKIERMKFINPKINAEYHVL